VIQPGCRVRILSPSYVAGELGIVLGAETEDSGAMTGYWIVSVERRDLIIALLPTEMELL